MQDTKPRSSRRRGSGTGSAYKRGSTWTAQVTAYTVAVEGENGQKKLVRKYRRKGGFRTKREALEYLERLKDSTERKIPALVDLWTLYEAHDLPRLSKDKQTAYRAARRRLEPLMGRKIDTLTTADLQDVVSRESTSYYTARDMRNVLSHLYKRAMADRFAPTNLAQFIVLPELVEKESTPFAAQEVDRIWEAYADGEVFCGYLLLMIYSGMMPGELLACRIDQIDLDRCEIYGCGKKTKTRKQAPIVFAQVVRPVVEALIAAAKGPKLITRARDRWYDDYHATLQRIGVRDLPPYSCRHTTGTEAARQQLPAPIIQRIMRHAKITTSQRYIHLGDAEAHAGLDVIPAPKIPEDL